MKKERIDKIISSQANISRSDARRDIKRCLVTVNGEIIRDFSLQVDPESCEIVYNGQALSYKKYVYLIMNKPAGVLSASNDKSRKTVVDLVPESLSRQGLFPVGRLDRDTTGLMLITDDGVFAHKVISPKSKIPKTYIAELDGNINEDMIKLFADGVTLADGARCKPALLKFKGEGLAEITITEGKYHQIKRMFGVVGLGVNTLCRISLGALSLPEDLGLGDCRELSKTEFQQIFTIY